MQRIYITFLPLLALLFSIIIPVTAQAVTIHAIAQASDTTVTVNGYYDASHQWITVQGAMVEFNHEDSHVYDDTLVGVGWPWLNSAVKEYQWWFSTDSTVTWDAIDWSAITEGDYITDGNETYFRTDQGWNQPIYTYLNPNPNTYYAHLRVFDNTVPLIDTASITITVDKNEVDAPNPVPEPTTMLLLGTGLLALAGFSRKKKLRP